MRGRVDGQGEVFHTFNVQDLIPADHPLREIKRRADRVLAGMSRGFNAAYGRTGRPSVPPERLIKALLLQALYSVRSEIQICSRSGRSAAATRPTPSGAPPFGPGGERGGG